MSEKLIPEVGDLVRFKVGCESLTGLLLSGAHRSSGEVRPGYASVRAVDATYGVQAEDIVEVVFAARHDRRVREAWLKSCQIEQTLNTGWALTTNARVTCVLLGLPQTRQHLCDVLRIVQGSPVDANEVEAEIAHINARLNEDGSERS